MRDFVQGLIDQGAMRVIERAVDSSHELAAVTQASQAESDAPILFTNVTGATMPVVTNLYGSHDRLCALIGAKDGNFVKRWTELSESFADQDAPATARVETSVDLVDGALSDLPQIHYFERDAGPYVTAGIFLAKEPETGIPNLSFHRAMFVDDSEMRVRLGASHDLFGYHAKAEAMDRPLEVAMLIGAPPEIFVAACASLPYEISELDAAAAIRGTPVEMRRCRTIDLEVPADAEIVVEGRLLPHVRRPEGPFGEFMGYYVPREDNVVFEITAVTWRAGAMFHSLLCGSPEDMRPLETAIAARIYQHLIACQPGILNVTCAPTLLNTVVQIDKQSPEHPKEVCMAAFDAHPDYSKCCIVVDADVDIYDLDQVMWAYLTRGRADTRAFIIENRPGFYRDAAGDHLGRLAIDATKPWGREAEFEKKSIPGAGAIDLADYLGGG